MIVIFFIIQRFKVDSIFSWCFLTFLNFSKYFRDDEFFKKVSPNVLAVSSLLVAFVSLEIFK